MAENKFDISSTFAIQCSICSQTNHISTSKRHGAGSRGPKTFDANSRVALAALDNGIGFSHVNSILTALDIPNMTRTRYKAREHEVGKIAEGVAKATCQVMFDKECELVKEMVALWILMVSYPCLNHMTWDGPNIKKCSTHNSYLFHSNSVWFLLQQTTCSTKFHLLREISLSQRKFCAKFCLPKRNFKRDFVLRGTKCHAKFQWYGNIDENSLSSKYRTIEFGRNSTKFALTTFA